MMRFAAAVVEHGDLTPLGPIHGSALLTVVAVVCVLVAALLIAMTVVLSKSRRAGRDRPARGSHNPSAGKAVWHGRIDDIVTRHANGELTRDQAFAELAGLARDFASHVSGTDMSTRTLSDLHRLPRTSHSQGIDLLRQTVGALYPPEFADARFNAPARETSVEQAADWVSRLVERWR